MTAAIGLGSLSGRRQLPGTVCPWLNDREGLVMLLKLAALGTLGYAAYRFIGLKKGSPQIAIAGGPLSEKATLQKNPDEPPAAHLYDD